MQNFFTSQIKERFLCTLCILQYLNVVLLFKQPYLIINIRTGLSVCDVWPYIQNNNYRLHSHKPFVLDCFSPSILISKTIKQNYYITCVYTYSILCSICYNTDIYDRPSAAQRGRRRPHFTGPLHLGSEQKMPRRQHKVLSLHTK